MVRSNRDATNSTDSTPLPKLAIFSTWQNSLEGQSLGDEGLTRFTVDPNISKYLLADYYWAAFRAAISPAKNGGAKGGTEDEGGDFSGARGVMCSYNR